MAKYLLSWDSVPAGSSVTVGVTPDDGIEVRGIVTFVVTGQPDLTSSLTFNQLVPMWNHTMAANESFHMTLVFIYHTTAVSSVKVDAECRTPAGAVHQSSYREQYDGVRGDEKHVFVSADR